MGGCYWANPAEDEDLFSLHDLLNSSLAKDLGLADQMLKTYTEESGFPVDLELFQDLAYLHGQLTENRGPQTRVGAVLYQLKGDK